MYLLLSIFTSMLDPGLEDKYISICSLTIGVAINFVFTEGDIFL